MLRTTLVVLALAFAALAAPAQARPLRPVATPFPIVVLPVEQGSVPVPPRAALARTFRRARAWYRRESGGRIDLRVTIAPPIPQEPAMREDGPADVALRRAAERGIDVAGALPVLIEALRAPERSFGSPAQVQIRGRSWRSPFTVVHELGHGLGLDHSPAPTACPRPFRPLGCLRHPRTAFDYGDALDVMGGGDGHLGAYGRAVLGLAPLRDVPARAAVTALRPVEARRPTLLRLRTAAWDYLVDTRRADRDRVLGRRVRAPAGAAIVRVRPRYVPEESLFPRPLRVPATDPGRTCRAGTPACLARQIFQPGRRFGVPGAFSLRVLRGGRVATRWLDRSPPALAVAGARVVVPAGAAPALELTLRTSARGAGVARIEVEQDGAVAAVDPDTVPGLVAGARGRGTVRVPLGAGPVARVRAVDAAGNASAWSDVTVAALPAEAAATVVWEPPAGPFEAAATVLRAGQVVTARGRTDPAFAGTVVSVEAVGVSEEIPPVEVAPDGTFAWSWSAPRPGLYILRLGVPVARAADGLNLVRERFESHVRG